MRTVYTDGYVEAENFLVAVQTILLILTIYRLRRVVSGRSSYTRDLFIITNFVAVGLPECTRALLICQR
jgi:hypothetical protein